MNSCWDMVGVDNLVVGVDNGNLMKVSLFISNTFFLSPFLKNTL